MSDSQTFDTQFILKYLPHRPPFLLIDKVRAMSETAIEASKLVSFNEPYLQGHFPGRPIMPGVLIVEAMAQAGGLMILSQLDLKPSAEKPFYLASIKSARFKRLVTPGDELVLKVTLEKHRGVVWQFAGEATVNGELAAQAEFINMQGSAD